MKKSRPRRSRPGENPRRRSLRRKKIARRAPGTKNPPATERDQALEKVKNLLAENNFDVIDLGIEVARSLDDPTVFEEILEGCSIGEEGALIRNEFFSSSKPYAYGEESDQSYLDIRPCWNSSPTFLQKQELTEVFKLKKSQNFFFPAKSGSVCRMAYPDFRNSPRWGSVIGDFWTMSTS